MCKAAAAAERAGSSGGMCKDCLASSNSVSDCAHTRGHPLHRARAASTGRDYQSREVRTTMRSAGTPLLRRNSIWAGARSREPPDCG